MHITQCITCNKPIVNIYGEICVWLDTENYMHGKEWKEKNKMHKTRSIGRKGSIKRCIEYNA